MSRATTTEGNIVSCAVRLAEVTRDKQQTVAHPFGHDDVNFLREFNFLNSSVKDMDNTFESAVFGDLCSDLPHFATINAVN